MRVTDRAAAADANRRACSSSVFSASATASAPQNVSPAGLLGAARPADTHAGEELGLILIDHEYVNLAKAFCRGLSRGREVQNDLAASRARTGFCMR